MIKQGIKHSMLVKLLLNLDNIHNIRYLKEFMYYFCDYIFIRFQIKNFKITEFPCLNF